MRRYCSVVPLAVIVAILISAGPGHAVPIISGSGLASPAATISFSESVFGAGTTITNQFSSLGVTFSPYLIYQSPQATECCDGIAAHHLGNTGSTTLALANPFSIQFGATQKAAAFGLATQTTTTLFEARLAGTSVEHFFTATADEYGQTGQPIGPFFGFSGIDFDEIRVTLGVSTLTDSPGSLRALVDNIQLSELGQGPEVDPPPVATPEPTTLLLVGTSAGGLGLLRWRRRRRTS
jgi:hypothetical protein